MKKLYPIVLFAGMCAILMVGCGKPQSTQEPPMAGSAKVGTAPAEEQPGEPATLKIAVACGVAGPYGEIRKLFKDQNPNLKIEQEVGNIVTVAKQFRDGKMTADMFMTIGSTALRKLNEDGFLMEDPVTFAEDLLVVLVPEGNPAGISEFEDVAGPEVNALAVAASASTPGEFAEMALKRANLWEKVKDRVVRPELPSMLKSFVSQGKADAAVMLLTCATKESSMGEEPAEGVPEAEIALRVPHEYYDTLGCQIGIMEGTENVELCRQFVEFLQTQQAQDILSKWDFVPCEGAG